MENICDDLNFDKLFKIMICAMKLNRCHPDIPRDRKFILQFTLMHGLFFFVFCLLIYSIFFFDIKNGDTVQICATGVICIIFGVVTLKYSVMLWFQRLLKGLMDEMKVDYSTAKSFSFNEQQILRKYSRNGKKVVKMWVIIGIVAPSLFLVKSIFLMIYYAINGKFKLVHIHEFTYPSPVEEIKDQPLVFCIFYLIFIFYAVYAGTMYIATAALGPVFMLHCCGQLEIVKERIYNIFKENDSGKITFLKLCDIVKYMQKIHSFLDRTQQCFHWMYEIVLRFAVVLLPISIYQIIQSYHKGDIKVEFISILIGGFTIISSPCYYSDKIMEMGENIRVAIYMCGWENHLNDAKNLRTLLLIIQLRASRAMGIRTTFHTLCLDTLTDVFHQAYAIFNFLNATP